MCHNNFGEEFDAIIGKMQLDILIVIKIVLFGSIFEFSILNSALIALLVGAFDCP